jgi:pyrroline-5-carboxylate reductase
MKLGVIGGGVMGEAIISCLLRLKIYQPLEIMVSDRSPERLDLLKTKYGICISLDNSEVFRSQVILLAVKPQVFVQEFTGEAIAKYLHSDPLIISIMAGITIAQLEQVFNRLPVIRAMPNTPAQVGSGITALCLGEFATSAHLEQGRQIFTAVGEAIEVPESMLNAVTGLSGSGPAYVAVMVEAMADGGVAMGLPRAIAMQLAIQTILGTAELLKQTGIHPGQLKDQVSSPGGTTIAGVRQLEKSGMRSAIIEAVSAASERAKELASPKSTKSSD